LLGLIEVLERDGRVRRALPVAAWPVSIGRALDNDVVLDDPHVAPHHVIVDKAVGQGPHLRALPSLNPVQVGRHQVAAGDRALLAAGDGTFTVGATRLRLRLPGEALAAERPLARAPWPSVTLLQVLALWAWWLGRHAIGLDPGAKAAEWMLPLLGAPAALALWCLLWALASKLFQHRFDFWPHLAVASRGLLAIEVVGFVLPWASALSGWSGPSRIAAGAAAACAVWMLLAHARLVLPHARRALAVAAGAAFAVGAAVVLALNQQRQERWFAELYVDELPPPALLWVAPASRDAFVAGATALRGRLEAQVRDAERESRAGEAAEDD
jgi:hypothetical protein